MTWSPPTTCPARHCISDESSYDWITCIRDSGHEGPHADPRGLIIWDLTDRGYEHDRNEATQAAARNSPAALAAEQAREEQAHARWQATQERLRQQHEQLATSGERHIREWLTSGDGQLVWRDAVLAPDGEIVRPATRAHVWLTDQTACGNDTLHSVDVFGELPHGAQLCRSCALKIGRLGIDALRTTT